jgi:hypothetical protein
MNHQDEDTSIKRRIKNEIGYTPHPKTIHEIWMHFQYYRDRYSEEDCFYGMQDKGVAKVQLETLLERAKNRFLAGEEILQPTYRRGKGLVIDRFLTADEIKLAKESQMIVNGHSYEEPMSIICRTGHLAVLNGQLDKEIDHLTRLLEIEADRQRRDAHRQLLETDVPFRKLVSFAWLASKEFRSSSQDVELAYLLFGYCTSYYDYRDRVLDPLNQLLEGYGLRYYYVYKLVALAKSYTEEGGQLPVIEPPYTRPDGKIYYGDYIHVGHSACKVEKVGHKYIHTDKGQLLKREVRHFERVPYVENPVTIDDYLFNELARLNNYRTIPDAHLKSLSEIVYSLYLQKRATKSYRAEYDERIQEDEDPIHKLALHHFRDGLRFLELVKQLDVLKALSGVHFQTSYAQILQEFEELKNSIPYPLVV